MRNLHMTCHAEKRKQQRGLRDADVTMVLELATQVAPDAYMLTRKDAAREIARRKREIQQLERLCGCKVVVEDGAVITCYQTRAAAQKRTLRNGRARQ